MSMDNIKKLFKFVVMSLSILTIIALMSLIGSINTTAIGTKNTDNSSELMSAELLSAELMKAELMTANNKLDEISTIYTDFMNEIYPIITGENINFKNISVDSIKKYLSKITDLYPNIMPVKVNDTIGIVPHISSPFGWRIHPITHKMSFHKGVDIDLPLYTKIYTTMSGTVTSVKYTTKETYGEGYGNYIVVRNNLGFETVYAHLGAIYVKQGQKVTKGQLIANLGKTGNATGPCLHYEILQGGVRKNPMDSLFMNYQIKLLANNKN